VKANNSKTDWARVDAMREEEIDTSDSPELTEQFFLRAKPWSSGSGKVKGKLKADVEKDA
jgi:hypothetical protein